MKYVYLSLFITLMTTSVFAEKSNHVVEYNFHVFKKAKIVKGDIIEVGLGYGDIAELVLDETRVKSYTSYEIDPVVVAQWNEDNPIKHKNHTIIEGNFITATKPNKKYDTGILDIFDGKDDYKNGKNIIKELKKSIKKGGVIIIEYMGDIPEENDFRDFMEVEIGVMKTEFVNTGIKGSSRHIAYYEVK